MSRFSDEAVHALFPVGGTKASEFPDRCGSAYLTNSKANPFRYSVSGMEGITG